MVDLFSKQAHFVACFSLPSAYKLAKLFVNYIYRLHGVPRRIISDRGGPMYGQILEGVNKVNWIILGLSSAFHLTTNRTMIHMNTMVEQYLRCSVNYQ